VISAAITLCVASQPVFIVISVYFFMTQSGNFWIHPRMLGVVHCLWYISYRGHVGGFLYFRFQVIGCRTDVFVKISGDS
jgi:hypothetical protein